MPLPGIIRLESHEQSRTGDVQKISDLRGNNGREIAEHENSREPWAQAPLLADRSAALLAKKSR